MSTLTAPDQQFADTMSDELDLLIPPSMAPVKKFIVSLTIVAVTIALVQVVNGGYLYPSAFAADDRLPVQISHVDLDQGTFAVVVSLRNSSARTVRLTDVRVNAPGAEVVDVTLSNPTLKYPRSVGDFITIETPPDPDSTGVNLPADLKPKRQFDEFIDDEYLLTLWLRPTSCQTLTSEWGTLEVTVDFGEWSLPQLSETTRFEGSLWSAEGRADGWTSLWKGQDRVISNGPLEVACEALQ